MLYEVWIDASGCEQIALDQEVYHWNLCVRKVDQPPNNHIKVGEFRAEFPDAELAARLAVQMLEARRNEVYVEAAREAQAIEERRQKLLALPWSGK